jgi:hypothetical protein
MAEAVNLAVASTRQQRGGASKGDQLCPLRCQLASISDVSCQVAMCVLHKILCNVL